MIAAPRMMAWSDEVWARWWEGLAAMAPETLSSTVDASFLTPLGILTHIANIEMAWIDVAQGEKPQWARNSTKKWAELSPVREYWHEARARTHATIDGLDEAGLAKRVPASDFEAGSFTIEEILFTILTHECHHRGELIAVLWQKNIEPPVSDYPRYATKLA